MAYSGSSKSKTTIIFSRFFTLPPPLAYPFPRFLPPLYLLAPALSPSSPTMHPLLLLALFPLAQAKDWDSRPYKNFFEYPLPIPPVKTPVK